MSATHELATTVRRGVVELTRPGEGDLGEPEMARFGRLVLTVVIAEDRPPTLAETRIVLRAPLRLFAIQVLLWLAAALLFGVLNSVYSGQLGLWVAIIVMLTGLVTASCAYLLTELILRPAAARALSEGMPGRPVVPGVATRAVLAWVMGTGLPVCGLVAIGIFALGGDRAATPHQLGIVLVVLGGTGIAVGLLAVTVAARATADP
jgi:adenylate cyclase